jgi:hypothetical protein
MNGKRDIIVRIKLAINPKIGERLWRSNEVCACGVAHVLEHVIGMP